MSGAVILFRNPIFKEIGKILKKIETYPFWKAMAAYSLLIVGQFTIMILGVMFVDWTMWLASTFI